MKTLIVNPTLLHPVIDCTQDPGVVFSVNETPVVDIDFSFGSMDFVNVSQAEFQYSFDSMVVAPKFAGSFQGNGSELTNITPTSIAGGLTGTFCGLRFTNGILVEEVAT